MQHLELFDEKKKIQKQLDEVAELRINVTANAKKFFELAGISLEGKDSAYAKSVLDLHETIKLQVERFGQLSDSIIRNINGLIIKCDHEMLEINGEIQDSSNLQVYPIHLYNRIIGLQLFQEWLAGVKNSQELKPLSQTIDNDEESKKR